MKLSFRDSSVFTKVFASMGLIILALVLFQLLYFPGRHIRSLNQALQQKGESLGRLMAHELREPLKYEDAKLIKAIYQGAAQDKDFVYAAVFNVESRDGRLVPTKLFRAYGISANDAGNLDAKWVTKTTSAGARDGILRVYAPVVHEETEGGVKTVSRGVLVLGLSTKAIHAESRFIRATTIGIGLAVILIGGLLAFFVARSLGDRLRAMANVAKRVANGDLTVESLRANSDDDVGVMAGAFNQMVARQRDLVRQISATAVALSGTATEFAATAQQQQRGATQQSSAVEETRKTMNTLLESAGQIATSAQSVHQMAEQSQKNSQVVAERILALSGHTQRIRDTLEVIKGIANKSELLALNAALEGTKAGEAGKGFSLVATQMQRLAENVMGSVKDIKELTATITESSNSSVLATEESTKLAADTTRSARQIALISQQQQSGTEQVTRAMDEVTEVASQTAFASGEMVNGTTEVMQLCERLNALVGQFQLNAAPSSQSVPNPIRAA